MKLSLLVAAAATVAPAVAASGVVEGFDISGYQPDPDFEAAYKDGARFVIIKATEGTYYKSKSFKDQVAGAKKAGLVWGAYHFAMPPDSSGAKQAEFFLENGGDWKQNDKGEHMPGMLDFERPPNMSQCYGMSAKEIVEWTTDFSDTYYKKTGRRPIIYTGSAWWQECTKDSHKFSKDHPLALSQWGDEYHTVPGDWGKPTIWQKNDHYKHGGDSDEFYGSVKDLKRFAGGILYHDLL